MTTVFRTIQSIGIYYGSSGGATKDAAEQLADLLLSLTGLQITLTDIAKSKLPDLPQHDLLLLGCSTWNWGDLQDDWDDAFKAFQELDLQGVQVGFFGCGDQYGYPDTFGDALGTLAEAAAVAGATLVGRLPFEGYEFTDSGAVQGGELVGLLLDDDNEPEKTPERIQRWVTRLSHEMQLPVREGVA